MRTLALRGGARVAVVAAEWRDAFAVVTRGRVQLELRNGELGPVLGRDAVFWLRGTGVRALRNPGRRTATVRVVTPRSTHPRTTHRRYEMNSTNDTIAAAPPGRTSRAHRRLAGTGLLATLAAMAATALVAALVRATGVDFMLDSGEPIPPGGFAVVTGVFSVVGVVIAAALLRWSARPAERFRWTAVSLTAISMVPPILFGANTPTVIALVGLHLIPAAIMIPALTHPLRLS